MALRFGRKGQINFSLIGHYVTLPLIVILEFSNDFFLISALKDSSCMRAVAVAHNGNSYESQRRTEAEK